MTQTANPFDAVMNITPRPPIVFVSGQGSWLTDIPQAAPIWISSRAGQ